ncbi:alanyl-tRNA synthetase [Gloeomargarita lithophora Alchichica-D10]|uniref:Alanine--tRNA ligase n=1 Tax=Gloeomargarita lithophora Alchichica-D10 TaxID=1188229 RepID=A0A1J0A982_9CYAN|nr:alanine--tRNA ligase [Gloeomargarita lithophora]APB32498.1 alanyl-tRNA synthetase [Gloeomargarita lithophora Alchichica-D10]
MPLAGDAIRQKFLEFYAQHSHQVLPSASLIPSDPTVLLTIAGMLPFKPIFLGQQAAPHPRVTTAQRCLRTNDIENVGRTRRHHTFFEMLGNFSFGDYFKAAAIAWAWELVTQGFGLPPEQLAVSVYAEDTETLTLWQEVVGLPPERIQKLGAEDNFWAAGPTGPCGPCSEIYYDFTPQPGAVDLTDEVRFVEIYNLVFMELNRDLQGNVTPLAHKNIDTGMGLERLARILQNVPSNYETDLIFPVIEPMADWVNVNYQKANVEQQLSLKIIGDHLRAVVHLIADGVIPSNVRRGYILRRLIRRLVRHGRLLGLRRSFSAELALTAIDLARPAYPHVAERTTTIQNELHREEQQFLKTLDVGQQLLFDVMTQKPPMIGGKIAFDLAATYGFPVELTAEIAAEHDLTVDTAGYEQEMTKHRELSREGQATVDVLALNQWVELTNELGASVFTGYLNITGTTTVQAILQAGERVSRGDDTCGDLLVILQETPFYAESGGQVGDTGYIQSTDDSMKFRVVDVQKKADLWVHYGRVEQGELTIGMPVQTQVDRWQRVRTQAHHTATHLLQAALQKLIDPHIAQAGSLVTAERLRFDFNCSRALTPAELQQIEWQINRWIIEAHQAQVLTLPLAAAKAKGAMAMFGEKYSDPVRVIDIPGVSMELCGGTHVSNTTEIGLFKIVAETGIASGIRRLEAVAGLGVLDYLNQRDRVVKELTDLFKIKPEEITDRVRELQQEMKSKTKQIEELNTQLARSQALQLLTTTETINGYKLLVGQLGQVDGEALRNVAQELLQKLGKGAVVLGAIPAGDKVTLVAAFSPEVVKLGLQAGRLVGDLAKLCGGGGGGRPNLAQAGGKDPQGLPKALDQARQELRQKLAGQ